MTRKVARDIALQLGFAAAMNDGDISDIIDSFFSEEHYSTLAEENIIFSEKPNDTQLEYIRRLTTLIHDNKDELDGYIERYAHGWKLERISKTALAVLRCAICEVLYMDDVPNAAAINEAVELAKGYDSPDTVAFINGVLGGFMRGEIDKTE